MTDEGMQPKEESEDDQNNPPMDDSGINNDYILELCDFIITKLWTKYFIEDKEQKTKIDVKELKELAYTLQAVWALCQDIIELDRRLRMGGSDNHSDGDMFGPEDGFPHRPDEEY